MNLYRLHLPIFAVLLTAIPGGAESYPITVESNLPVRMRDGVILRADAYRPQAPGKFPVLLERTPYNKCGSAVFALRAAALGYVVIFQDVRGRFASEGDWYPIKYESQDGYDTVEWAAGLPYSNGKVGMFGDSYNGATVMLAAVAHPPHLAAIVAGITTSNYYNGWAYHGGALEQWFDEQWASNLSRDTLDRRVQQTTRVPQWASRLPLTDFPLVDLGSPRGLAPYFFDWLAHPAYDDYWKQWSIEGRYDSIRVPAWIVGGWYDLFLGGTLRNYVGLKQAADKLGIRPPQLVVGPWDHASTSGKTGDVDFGPRRRAAILTLWLSTGLTICSEACQK